ncbi:SAM-dependent methyltransferase [Streptomyces virginiae]|uniref:SAM-dependent methyltransferase n=1 Tax=Streptomyces virginiae TaxID=1961 RepID=UPI0036CF1C0C
MNTAAVPITPLPPTQKPIARHVDCGLSSPDIARKEQVAPHLTVRAPSAELPAPAPSRPTLPSGREPELPRLDPSAPSVARVCNFITGGTDNFPADRALGRHLLTEAPWLDRAAAAARNHGQQAVARLAAQGVIQFLDLGCGLPQRHGHSTHDAARRHQPQSTVVYVDRDPTVQLHVRTRFAQTPWEPALHADITSPAHLLAQSATAHLDRTRPIAVLLHEVLPWISDGKARHLLDTLRNWLPASSVLSVVHAAADSHPVSTPALAGLYHKAGILYRPRSLKQLLALMEGWKGDAPGITAVLLGGLRAVDGRTPLYGSYAFLARVPHLSPSGPPGCWGTGSDRKQRGPAGGAMTAPYFVRGLTPEDFPSASRLLARRWSREADCGRPVDHDRDYALILPLRTGDQGHPQLHGLFEGEDLVAMWELDPTSSGPGWSASECGEVSVSLLLLYSDPGHRNAGRLVSLWLADHLARASQPPAWLRCTTLDARLAAHITRTWGWREVWREGGRHLLQLAPELKPRLDLLVAEPSVCAAPDGSARPLALARNDQP